MDIKVTVESLTELTQCSESLLHQAAQDLKDVPVNEFVDSKVGKLFGIVKEYHKCFSRLNVMTREEMHDCLEKQFRHREIQEKVEHLEEVERDWDTFLKGIDSSMYKDETEALSVGDKGPLTNSLINARSGESALELSGGRVMVISFGGQIGAKQWLQDTGCTFTMLLDQDREIYKAFGLRRSVFKVWCIKAMEFYAEQLAAGVPPITPYENVEDDPHQMGGDFILDKNGTIQLLYCSKTSSDRPPVTVLLQALKDISCQSSAGRQ